MLAIFCLRLALGMLAALIFLSYRRMHPRFFRTHFLTALGLCIVALMTGWSISSDEGPHLVWRLLALVVAVAATLAGAVVWIFEIPPAGWTLLTTAVFAQVAALSLGDMQQADARRSLSLQGAEPVALMSAPALIANDVTSAAVLGFAMTAMLVGHSYLISPGLSINPLKWQIIGLGIALAARIAFSAAALWFWTGDHDITNVNDETVLFLPVRWLIGLVGPLVFGFMAFQTARIRSTQSATGILYVVVILTFLGELMNLLLTRRTGLPL